VQPVNVTAVAAALFGVFACLPLAAAESARFVVVNGVSLRYELRGSRGPVVVLIPEVGMGLEDWDEVLPGIAAGRRVLRYDPRGAGLSEKIRGVVTYGDHVEDLHALLGQLAMTEPVTLVGAAMGGGIALQFAARFPQQVRALVALSPATGASAAARPNMLADADKLEQMGVRAWIDYQQPDVYPPSLHGSVERVARWRALQLANDAASWAASTRMIANADFSGVAEQVRCPALIVAAAFYPPRPPERVKLIADAIPGAQFAVLDTGHFMPVQAPELLTPLLNRFLKGQGL
jgi:3-oxoadipate enol-lactonase